MKHQTRLLAKIMGNDVPLVYCIAPGCEWEYESTTEAEALKAGAEHAEEMDTNDAIARKGSGCAEFDADGTCIHSDHMARAGF